MLATQFKETAQLTQLDASSSLTLFQSGRRYLTLTFKFVVSSLKLVLQ